MGASGTPVTNLPAGENFVSQIGGGGFSGCPLPGSAPGPPLHDASTCLQELPESFILPPSKSDVEMEGITSEALDNFNVLCSK